MAGRRRLAGVLLAALLVLVLGAAGARGAAVGEARGLDPSAAARAAEGGVARRLLRLPALARFEREEGEGDGDEDEDGDGDGEEENSDDDKAYSADEDEEDAAYDAEMDGEEDAAERQEAALREDSDDVARGMLDGGPVRAGKRPSTKVEDDRSYEQQLTADWDDEDEEVDEEEDQEEQEELDVYELENDEIETFDNWQQQEDGGFDGATRRRRLVDRRLR